MTRMLPLAALALACVASPAFANSLGVAASMVLYGYAAVAASFFAAICLVLIGPAIERTRPWIGD